MEPMRARDALTTTSKAAVAFVIVALVCPLAAAGTMLATQLFIPLPAVIPEPEPPEAIRFSEVYDVNGELIHTYKAFDQNIPVAPEDIPQTIKNAVIAAEDRNFYNHSGFDARGTLRALITDVRQGELAQGGSTITQQLAKTAYGVGTERTLSRKVREAILAAQLDRSLSKEQILYEYLTLVYWGEGAYGIGAAAQVYFGKPVNELDISEAAVLAGLLPAPSAFNPRADSGTSEIRRQQVLDAMLSEEMITPEEYEEHSARQVWLASAGAPPGPATVVADRQTESTRYPYFIQYLTQELVRALGAESDAVLSSGGYKIYTTLDPRVQEQAEATIRETTEGVENRVTTTAEGAEIHHTLQMSITAVEPPTGYVRALVGGKDWNLPKGQVNMATGAGTTDGHGRQPGSSFKPIVLAEAFEQGIKPSDAISGAPLTIGDYSPENYGGSVYGDMTLRTATEKSVNTAYVRLMQQVDPYEVVDLANELGLNVRPIDPQDDGSGLSIALGSREVTSLGMASAYGTFANRGVRMAPTPIVRVFGPEGELIVDNSEPAGDQVLKEATADNVTDVLRGVITNGTASGRGIDRPAAGKTGTTQNNNDGWFVGYTPTLSTAVFVGWDPPIGEGFSRTVNGVSLTGSSIPARSWQRFMRSALEGVPRTDFHEPAPIVAPASEELQRERRGFAPAGQTSVRATDSGGPYVVESDPPTAPAPTSSTTTTSTTTSTTLPEPGGRGGPDDCRGFFCPDD